MSDRTRLKQLGIFLLCLVLGLALRTAPAAAKTLRIGAQADAGTMDPQAQNIQTTITLLSMIYEPLVTRDKSLAKAPMLAESWSQPSPNIWRFTLRPNVTFQDGAKLTAADVVFTIKRAQNPTSQFASFVGGLDSKVVDDLTVDIITPRPDPLLPDKLIYIPIMNQAWAQQHDALVPQDLKTNKESYTTLHANGTGPYTLTSRAPDSKTVLTLKYADAGDKNPFKDIRVREAIDMAIDRNAIVRTVMRGLASPTGQILAPNNVGYDAALDAAPARNVAEAKRLLAEAGYPDGFGFTMDCPNDRYINDEQVCKTMATMLSQIGVKVTLNSMPRAKFFPKVWERDTSMFMMGFNSPYFDGMYALETMLMTRDDAKNEGIYNYENFSDPALDVQIRAASEVELLVHGTTIGLNAIIQRRGARMALVVSKGNRDLLELARLRLPSSYDFTEPRERPLVPRNLVFEVSARIRSDGSTLTPPDRDEVTALVSALRAATVDAVAIVLLNAYRNPSLEVALAEALRAALPGLLVTTSGTIWPEVREYERGLVAGLNAYIHPLMARYLDRLAACVAELGIAAPIYITAIICSGAQ